MEHEKILNLMNEWNDSKFRIRKWNIINGQSNTNYDIGNKMFYNTGVLKFNLCDCNYGCILVQGDDSKIVHHLLNVSQKLME